MPNYLEILRLDSLNHSQRTIESTVHCSRHTVRSVLQAAKEKQIAWPLDDDITNAELEEILFPGKYKSGCRYVEPVLMEQALALPDNMENKELNARLREIAEERESILHQLGTLRQADERQAGQAARMNSLREFVERRETKFAVYDDAITRKFVEQITVLDAETIRIKFRYPGLEVDKSLN